MASSSAQKLVAEAIGTFALTFAGTAACVVNDVSNGGVTIIGVALSFGLVIMAMVYSIGDISGAHMNPAVTVGLTLSGRHPAGSVVPYIFSQLMGAFAASIILRLLFPAHPNLGATLPAGSFAQSFGLEIIITFFLMFVILNVTSASKETGALAGIAIGATITLGIIFAGLISGASMNPARSIAPALISGSLKGWWIYVTAPFVGAALAVFAFRAIRQPGSGK